jgi:hypothetical protein
MSLRALHAVTVRLLGDPRFRDAVYADPDTALADTPLDAEQRRWFTAVDPRAWDIDPMRNARILTALLDEYRVSGVALAAHGWNVSKLHGFFASPECHAALMAWQSLFQAFPAWLLRVLNPRSERAVGAMVRIDAAIALVRRAPFDRRPPPAVAFVRTAPTVAAIRVPAGALALWESQHRALAAASDGGTALVAELLGPQRTSATRGQRLPPFSHRGLDPKRDEAALITTRDGAAPEIAFVGDGLVDLFETARDDVARATLIDNACADGLDADEAEALIAALEADGSLVRGRVAKDSSL